jgi:secreted PhoX family phosphatase
MSVVIDRFPAPGVPAERPSWRARRAGRTATGFERVYSDRWEVSVHIGADLAFRRTFSDAHAARQHATEILSQLERFGFNADFTAFLPLNASATEGLLWVNHEYVGTETDNYGQAFREVRTGSGLNRRITAWSLPLRHITRKQEVAFKNPLDQRGMHLRDLGHAAPCRASRRSKRLSRCRRQAQRRTTAQPLVIQAAHGQIDGRSRHPARLFGSHEDRHVCHLRERR